MSKLKKILKERKMNQTQLYEKIKEQSLVAVPKYKLSRICSGQTKNYHVITLIKICRALGVTPNELLSKSDYDNIFKSVE